MKQEDWNKLYIQFGKVELEMITLKMLLEDLKIEK